MKIGPLTKKEVLAHLLDLRNYAENDDKDGFSQLALSIVLQRNPQLAQLFTLSKEKGYEQRDDISTQDKARISELDDMICKAYPCFQSGNFSSMFVFFKNTIESQQNHPDSPVSPPSGHDGQWASTRI
jgi:hypothetical protein